MCIRDRSADVRGCRRRGWTSRAVVLRDARRQDIPGQCGIGGRTSAPRCPDSRDHRPACT
eukprot:8062041-Pyramimonas_sp.AAC.1